LSQFNRNKKFLTLTLVVAIALSIIWSLPQGILPISAAATYSLSVSPTRIQEGLDTNITLSLSGGGINQTYTFQVNVTTSARVSFLKNFHVITNAAGVGSNTTNFWKDFSSPANTNRTGTYTVSVNQTLATPSSFTVGLTDKTIYLRSETVNIRASGYTANESVVTDLKYGSTSVSTFPRAFNATAEGIVSLSWVIPADGALGTYAVSVANATPTGTMKTPTDIQTFTVEGACEIQAVNLDGQALANVTVEIYNGTSGAFLNLAQDTNSTGWIAFVLGAGNYTFKAFWRNVEVGSITRNITENVSFALEVNLSNLKLTVQNDAGTPLPWVDLYVSYNYTTRVPETIPETSVFTTDLDGKVILQNVFTNINYRVSARRYGLVLTTTTIQSLPVQAWNNITVVPPTYTMLVKVLGSTGNPAAGLQASAYEWSSGTNEALESKPTDSQGNASFALTAGRYRLRFFKDSVFLNEVTVDLTQDQLSLVVKIDIYNIDLHVVVVDYFGQPMPNVSVEFQRKVDSSYQVVATQITGADGTASFDGVVGGDSLLQASLAGKIIMSQSLYLDEPSRQVMFKLGTYVSILGFVIDAGVFVTIVLVLIMVIAFILLSIRGKLHHLRSRQKKTNAN
jgi:5-hydroxyisourate hydrolase-like protein (transthyretin family)